MSKIFQKPPNDYQYQVGIANLIDVEDEEIIVNGAVGETPLQNVTVPASVMVLRGQSLDIRAIGRQTGAAAVKTIRLRANGVEIYQNQFTNTSNFQAWSFDGILFRQQNNLIGVGDMKSQLQLGPANPSAVGTETAYFQLDNFNFDIPLELSFSVEIAGAEQVTQKLTRVYVI